MLRILQGIPIQLGRQKCLLRVRIRDHGASLRRTEAVKLCKFASTSLSDRTREFTSKVAKELEWCFCSELFAHKKQRRRRRQQKDGHCRLDGFLGSEFYDSFSKRPVTYLIMVL